MSGIATDFRRGSAIAAALLALVLVGGCGGSERTREARAGDNGAAATTNAAKPGAQHASKNSAAADDEADEEEEADADSAGEEQERRGPTRQARCQIDDDPVESCTFTQVMGDGSFDISTSDRDLRLVVDGNEAYPFEVIGQRRIPIAGRLVRDDDDRACWVAADEDSVLRRVCVW